MAAVTPPGVTGSRQQIGHYQLVAMIGKGGMGEVYRARDTRLNRDEALKVLPQILANDPNSMARFQREAQLLASLNDPKIAAIYGLEESGSTRALVMELVEGPTLAERIANGPIPLDEAVSLVLQMANALAYAHDKGIIHRDLKPANIKLASNGQVKILDFGLAKAMSMEESSPDTITAPVTTGVGTVMGTPAYMSPEQARGKEVDRRTDVWSFGVVLYEMLTGERPFGGPTVSDTLAAVLREEPIFDSLAAERMQGTDGASYLSGRQTAAIWPFFQDGKLKVTDMKGGPPVLLCNAPDARGGTWGHGDLIRYCRLSEQLRGDRRCEGPKPVTPILMIGSFRPTTLAREPGISSNAPICHLTNSRTYFPSDIEGGTVPVSQCTGLSVIVSLSSPPSIS